MTSYTDLTIEDSNVLEVALKYRSDVKPVLTFSDKSALAWGARPDNQKKSGIYSKGALSSKTKPPGNKKK